MRFLLARNSLPCLVDDGIIAGPNKEDIDQIITDLQTMFNISNKGDLTDYLGVNIEMRDNGTIKLLQPYLFKQIIEDANFQSDMKYKATPAASAKILHKDPSGRLHCPTRHCCGIIGKLNFLEKSTRGELGYRPSRFCKEPTELHTDAVHYIVRFLAGTHGEGIILNPKKARMGYLLTFAKCPIVWASRLAGSYCLSTTEAKYVLLSTALRQVILLMDFLIELKAQGIVLEEVADLWTKLLISDLFAKFTKLMFGWDVTTANNQARQELLRIKKNKRHGT
jgi:hypothetical protein